MRSIRRTTVLRGLAAAVAIATVAAVARPAAEARSASEVQSARHDAWLAGLKGKHKQLFDSPAPSGGIMLVHILNYYDTYNKAYSVPDREINAIGTFYGGTTFLGLNDAMWAKYRLGEELALNGADGRPATLNPWRSAPQILGMTLPQASIESLQQRGATFIICNNALEIFAALLAQKRGLDPKVVYEDMKANILPGVTLVPAMVIAVEKAQAAGFTYQRQ
jgi:intracellular sulfur oxidation DsrE/DsrF family protein